MQLSDLIRTPPITIVYTEISSDVCIREPVGLARVSIGMRPSWQAQHDIVKYLAQTVHLKKTLQLFDSSNLELIAIGSNGIDVQSQIHHSIYDVVVIGDCTSASANTAFRVGRLGG